MIIQNFHSGTENGKEQSKNDLLTTDLARSGAIDKAACWFLKTKLIVAAVKHSP